MLDTTEIARHEWASFFDTLSRLHLDEPVRIEVLRKDIGAQLEVKDLPLDGIGADVKESGAEITIAAGSEPDRHITHVISDPMIVRIARGSGGQDEALEIVGADQAVTLVYFDGPKSWSART